MSRRGGKSEPRGEDSADELARSPWRQEHGGLGCGGEAKKRGAESFFSLLVIAPLNHCVESPGPEKGWDTPGLSRSWHCGRVEKGRWTRYGTHAQCGMTSSIGAVAAWPLSSYEVRGMRLSQHSRSPLLPLPPRLTYSSSRPSLGFLASWGKSWVGTRKRLGQSWKACRGPCQPSHL
ncbi:hypothetical protein LX36DRAFT_102057 [Colletotrichum falcatum]|nr:hypothetical protein LX36DRAFT_102057 [Colletotrichum falcatum]